MENRPVDVPESHFKDLLKCWNSSPDKKMSETNTENRNKLKCPHTAGRTPFALIREAKKKEMYDTSDTLSSKDIFVATRKRKLDRVYKSSYDNTSEMERQQSTQESCVRLYGRGVTKTVLKGKIRNLESSSDAADERMQQKMEEIEERMQQRMLEKLNEQKDAMEQHITMIVVARLQRLNPEMRLDPDMLRFVESSSAQQAVVQLNNRPSTGSNNQVQRRIERRGQKLSQSTGGVDQEMEEDNGSEELDLT